MVVRGRIDERGPSRNARAGGDRFAVGDFPAGRGEGFAVLALTRDGQNGNDAPPVLRFEWKRIIAEVVRAGGVEA